MYLCFIIQKCLIYMIKYINMYYITHQRYDIQSIVVSFKISIYKIRFIMTRVIIISIIVL